MKGTVDLLVGLSYVLLAASLSMRWFAAARVTAVFTLVALLAAALAFVLASKMALAVRRTKEEPVRFYLIHSALAGISLGMLIYRMLEVRGAL